MKKKLSLLTMAACLVLSGVPAKAADNYAYVPEKAITYAAEHITKEVQTGTECELVCDQFVKSCLEQANVSIRAGGVEEVKNALVQAGFGTEYPLKVSSDGIHITKADNTSAKAGDIMFIYCDKCDTYLHTVLISGFDEAGNMLAYGHNPIWDQVDWFGNMTHTTDDGEVHTNCYRFSAVSMDTTPTTHKHQFKQDQYETEHPHQMYDICDCGAKYYLGWNATVSSCTICNPVTSEVPVLTAAYSEADGGVKLQWTPVERVVNYELYRSKSENGTYFKISTTTGVKITNTSVEDGNTYYYLL